MLTKRGKIVVSSTLTILGLALAIFVTVVTIHFFQSLTTSATAQTQPTITCVSDTVMQADGSCASQE